MIKKAAFSLLVFLNVFTSLAQAPSVLSYQGIARDEEGVELSEQPIRIRITFRVGGEGGDAVYTEEHVPFTDEYGLFQINLGEGLSTDQFADIPWEQGQIWLQTEVNFSGGTEFEDLGTEPLATVPYAFYADVARNVQWKEKGDSLFFEGDQTVVAGKAGFDTLGLGVPGAERNLHVANGMRLEGASLPDSPVLGDLYVDSTTNAFRFYNGADWISLAGGDEDWTLIAPGAFSSFDQFQIGDNRVNGLNRNERFALLVKYDSSFVVNGSEYNAAGVFDHSSEWQYDQGELGPGLFLVNGSSGPSENTVSLKFLVNGPENLSSHAGISALSTGIHASDLAFQVETGLSDVFAEVMRMTSQGDVGIGTTTPDRKLHVNGEMKLDPLNTVPLSPELGDLYVDANTNSFQFYDGTAWVDLTEGGGASPWQETASDRIFYADRVRIGEDLDLSDNRAKLYVKDTISVNTGSGEFNRAVWVDHAVSHPYDPIRIGPGMMLANTADVDFNTVTLNLNPRGFGRAGGAAISGVVTDLDEADITFQLEQFAQSNVYKEIMRLKSSGNVGVGESEPARTLHVNGPMRLTPQGVVPSDPEAGDFYFDDTTKQLRYHNGSAWVAPDTGYWYLNDTEEIMFDHRVRIGGDINPSSGAESQVVIVSDESLIQGANQFSGAMLVAHDVPQPYDPAGRGPGMGIGNRSNLDNNRVGLNMTVYTADNSSAGSAISTIAVGRDEAEMAFQLETGTALEYREIMRMTASGHVGIGASEPERTLHVAGGMRLEPLASAPNSPDAGDMYFDQGLGELRYHDGASWYSVPTGSSIWNQIEPDHYGTMNRVHIGSDRVFSGNRFGLYVKDTVSFLSGGSELNAGVFVDHSVQWQYDPGEAGPGLLLGNSSIGPDNTVSLKFQVNGELGISANASISAISSDIPHQSDITFQVETGPPADTYSEVMRITHDEYVGIGTPTPAEKLTVAGGGVYIEDPGQGIILTSPNGGCWSVSVDNFGALTTLPTTCP